VLWLAGVLLVFAEPAAGQAPGDPGAGGGRVLVSTVSDVITPVIADHVTEGIRRAEQGRYEAYVLQLDTPGGLDTSMREIVKQILGARVPVVVYVSPPGARAASAGSVITLASHVAAMAPGTAIGAATPVLLGAEEPGAVDRKVLEDAKAYVEELARLRERNVEFHVETVTEARSEPARVALEIGAIDFVATSLPDLLDDIDGAEVALGDRTTVTLATAGAAIDTYDMGLFRRILQWLANPTVAFLLMSVGTLGLIYELASPGVGVAGVVGAVFILLSLFALAVLPVNTVGFIFLALALALFAAELFAPGVGVFAALGAVCLVLAGVFLFRETPDMRVSLAAIIPIAVVVGGGVVLAGRFVVRARSAPVTTSGPGQFIGRTVTVAHARGNRGQAFVEGAWWQLRAGHELRDGDVVRVSDLDSITLVVEAPEPAAAADPGQTAATSEGEEPRP
jgi:membrane-bound serine protease (ClpP class)